MTSLVRAVPIRSKEEAQQLCADIRDYPDKEAKQAFAKTFGEGTVEDWYYQEIEGKPYLIAVSHGGDIAKGHAEYSTSELSFFQWFRDRIEKLSGLDLRTNPQGAEAEYIGRIEA